MTKTAEHIERYARHIVLPEIGGPGQKKLGRARVSIVGIGGVGGPAALYLAASGIGTLRLIDHDVVSLSNLHRQVLFTTRNVGTLKTDAAKIALQSLNPLCRIETVCDRLTPDNARNLLSGSSIVLDGCDSFATRLDVNSACLALRLPLVSGAVGRWQVQLSLFDLSDPRSACYGCLVPLPPQHSQDCATLGIPGPLTGIPGSYMALEAVKYISGAGRTLAGRLLLLDGLSSDCRIISLARDPTCPHCAV